MPYGCLTSFITRVGDEALIAIGQCSSLQYLNVSGCHQIGDTGIIAIARGCPLLTYLDVSVLQVCFSHTLILELKIFHKKCSLKTLAFPPSTKSNFLFFFSGRIWGIWQWPN